MSWDGGYWDRQKKVENLRSKIRMLEQLGFHANKAQRAELDKLRKDLEGEQNSCSHTWDVVQLFSKYRQFCRICDKENTDYDYWKATKK